jgi:hypothetical protein
LHPAFQANLDHQVDLVHLSVLEYQCYPADLTHLSALSYLEDLQGLIIQANLVLLVDQ